MEVKYGNGKTNHGPGIQINLDGNEVALAIMSYLKSHDVHVNGPQTITVNGEMIEYGGIYVDPSGLVVSKGKVYSGNGSRKF